MTDNRTTELLPCPICGRKATVSSWWSDAEECGIAGVGCSRESYVNGYECARIIVMRIDEKTALEDAVRIWNTRAAHGTLTAEQVSKATYAHSIHADCADADWQAIADELNAELGSGTCENANTNGYVFRFGCSECGYSTIVHNCAVRLDELPNYCPNCGKAVSA